MKNNKNNFQSNFATLRAFPMGNDTLSGSLGRPLASRHPQAAFHAALEPILAILRLLGEDVWAIHFEGQFPSFMFHILHNIRGPLVHFQGSHYYLELCWRFY